MILSESDIKKLDYWDEMLQREVVLENSWYQRYFTDVFGIPIDYYKNKRILDINATPRGSLLWAENAMQRIALNRLANYYPRFTKNQDSMTYIAANPDAIPFVGEYFDIISCFDCFKDEIHKIEFYLNEIVRTLATGGLILIIHRLNFNDFRFQKILRESEERFFQNEKLVIDHLLKLEFRNSVLESINVNLAFDFDNSTYREGLILAKIRKRKA